MTVYLTRADVLCVAARVFESQPQLRDIGLLESAVARPKTTVFGADAYATTSLKAAALLHLLARNHAFVDGNKRTAWASAWLFLGYNGIRLAARFDVDAAEAFMNDVSAGKYDGDLTKSAEVLRSFSVYE